MRSFKYPSIITDGKVDVVIICLDIVLIDPSGILLPNKDAQKIADIIILPEAYNDYASVNDIGTEPKNEGCRRLIRAFNTLLRGRDKNGFYTCENGMKIYLDSHVKFDPKNTAVHYTDRIPLACAEACPSIPILTNNQRIENTVLKGGKFTTRSFIREAYTGRRDVKMSPRSSIFRKWLERGYITLKEFTRAFPEQPRLRVNEFVEWQLPNRYTRSSSYKFWDFIGRYRYVKGDGTSKGEWRIQSIANTATSIPFFRPAHAGQAMLLDLASDPSISRILCQGDAGTGKTHTVTSYATSTLLAPSKGTKARYHKYIAIVPETKLGKDYGALPGGIEEKMLPKLRPFVKNLTDILMTKAKKEGKPINFADASKWAFTIATNPSVVEIMPMIDMQGSTEKYAIIVGDECEEYTVLQIISALTRGGEGCLTILFGDVKQSTRDSVHTHLNDFDYIFHKIAADIDKNPTIGLLVFKHSEQARDEAITALLNTIG